MYRRLLGGIVVAGAVLVGCAACGGGGGNTNPALNVVILDQQGHDVGKTNFFSVPDNWGIAWSYHGCEEIKGVPYLQAAVYQRGDTLVDIAIKDFHGKSDSGDFVRQQGAGTYYVGVSSTCPWQVKILAESHVAQPKNPANP